MVKKKKIARPKDKEFANNPFNTLKGFAVSTSDDKSDLQPASPKVKKSPEVFGTFAGEMDLLGVQRLKGQTEEPEEENLESRPPRGERKESAAPQSEEELFRQSVGEMQVRFSDRLPEDDEPVTASPRRMKQLKQGKLVPEATLDLHGLQRVEVADKMRFFLQDAAYQRWRTVLVITGKGLHSEEGEPVLRAEAERFLNGEGRKWVAEWGRAPRQYGGEGALVLFLRKR